MTNKKPTNITDVDRGVLETIVANADEIDVTFFVPFTRKWFVNNFLLNLEQLRCNWNRTEVIFYNDTDDQELSGYLRDWLQRYQGLFGGAKLYTSNNPVPGEFDAVGGRRERIVAMKQKSKELIGDSELVFCIEDDTLVPADALNKLMYHMQNPDTAVASGIQVGRWAYKIIGAWNIQPVDDPVHVSTVPFQGTGLQYVDATGWYCYLTRTEFYKDIEYRFEGECFGPDVCYSWDLRKRGLNVVLDWEVKCAHVTKDEILYPDNTITIEHWNKENNSWMHV